MKLHVKIERIFGANAKDEDASLFRVRVCRLASGKSFNGKSRDECLNDNVFTSIAEAREIIEQWRVDYNECRPHRSLGQMTANAFAIDQTDR